MAGHCDTRTIETVVLAITHSGGTPAYLHFQRTVICAQESQSQHDQGLDTTTKRADVCCVSQNNGTFSVTA